MNAPDYLGRHGAPRPPRDIEAEMEQAGADGDDVKLGVAKARYVAWMRDQGYEPGGAHGSNRPDGAVS